MSVIIRPNIPPDCEGMTEADFDELLEKLVRQRAAEDLLAWSDIYNACAMVYAAEVFERWRVLGPDESED